MTGNRLGRTMSDKGSDTGTVADEQPESRGRDPWAPPERRVPLDKPAVSPVPGQRAAVPPAAPGLPAPSPYPSPSSPAPAPPWGAVPPPGQALPPQGGGTPAGGLVPPVPQAPTGPGTPSAYAAGFPGQQMPYGGLPGGPAPYGQGVFPGGQAPYGQGGFVPGSYGYPAGAYPNGWPPHAPNGPSAGNGLGVAALVLGIVGTVLSPTVLLGVVLGILAVVFGGIGRSKVRNGEADNGGQALAGLILGGVALVVSGLMLTLYLSVDTSDGENAPQDDPGSTYRASLVVDRPVTDLR
ncbi:hypothetical protein CTZ27_16540 [Streptomyces griseocarneus]|nr:hypothetical protein CTZ27_16540 [Streptomyces griseocarneus]